MSIRNLSGVCTGRNTNLIRVASPCIAIIHVQVSVVRSTLFVMIHADQLAVKSVRTLAVRSRVLKLARPVKSHVHGKHFSYLFYSVLVTCT